MADHLVDQIAEKFKFLLWKNTEAYDRVYRDRGYNFEAEEDLPAIDISIGEDNPPDGQVQGKWTSDVQINVDLYVRDQVDYVSSALLTLRKETFRLIMAEYPVFPLSGVINIVPGGATEVGQSSEGVVAVAVQRTVYFVTYRHSLTDPSL